MAADVGKKLLGEVEEMRLDGASHLEQNIPSDIVGYTNIQAKLLHDHRVRTDIAQLSFNFQPLDRILSAATQAWPPGKVTTSQPIVELMSLAAGDGKTQLLYHICSKAVLPHHVDGQQAAVVIIDADGRFMVDHLAKQIQTLFEDIGKNAVNSEENSMIRDEVLSALKHVHVFRPQSLAGAIATLNTLPGYLFNQNRHHSYDREIAFIAIDSASAFYWQDQASMENARFQAATGEDILERSNTSSGYQSLFASLKMATNMLKCPAIVTTWQLQPVYADSKTTRSYRQQLPDFRPTLRLVVRRLAVRKFPPGITVEQALRESADRQRAVDQGKFECSVNQYGMDERSVKAFAGDRGGFGFRIDEGGVIVDTADDDEVSDGGHA